MKPLIEIENELSVLVTNDKTSWIKIYKLLQEVEERKLYLENYRSFTAWINAFAQESKVNVSLLWSRLKAGRYYNEYEKKQKELGKRVAPLDEIDCSADCFVFIEKISKDNAEISAPLIEKAISHELTRKDFQKAYEEKKRVKQTTSNLKVLKMTDNEVKITANDIVMAFTNNTNWLDYKIKKYQNPKYHVFQEFGVQTGTSRHARRMDLLVIETFSTEKEEIYTHGIEIKVDKADLLNDHKMQEYREHCEFFWIAIPDNLKEYAEKVCCENWGIITISDDKKITVVKRAIYYNAIFKNETIKNALLRLM